MKVLVACEFSGIVRDAFIAAGHDAMSCDLLPTERPGPHYEGDVRDVLDDGWDLMVAHPPCTYLTVSGNRWMRPEFVARFPNRAAQREAALAFVRLLLDAPIPRIALENPVSVISSAIRPPDQTIQPYQFGHGEVKRTCLWLKNLPPLRPTGIVAGRAPRTHVLGPGPDRWKERSRTLPGIAAAMAEQWGNVLDLGLVGMTWWTPDITATPEEQGLTPGGELPRMSEDFGMDVVRSADYQEGYDAAVRRYVSLPETDCPTCGYPFPAQLGSTEPIAHECRPLSLVHATYHGICDCDWSDA